VIVVVVVVVVVAVAAAAVAVAAQAWSDGRNEPGASGEIGAFAGSTFVE
jgi:hypothetical protein